jgi:hypothetical protein
MVKSAGIDEILPLLVSTYQRGRLVPFLGAGMSAPRLTQWKEFVCKLESEGRVPACSTQLSLEARAQRICTIIQNRDGRQGFLKALANALENSAGEAPPQTQKLAEIRWPLTVSSNYDDLFFYACRCQPSTSQRWQNESGIQILGRSAKDCKLIISSLAGPFDRQYIWHVQGFLGGQYPGADVVRDVPALDELRDQLVVGHAEYRRVSNRSPEFRRCFTEVFNTRSFLFLGSSLQEEYFLNLFGEVLDLCGPSAVPHFAFAEEGQVDVRFLADQMNITVCEFPKGDWAKLPLWLDDLKYAIERPKARNSRWCFGTGCPARSGPDLEIVCGQTHVDPAEGEAIAFVARRDRCGIPVPPPPFSGLASGPKTQISPHVFEYPGPVYAVTARCHDDDDDQAVYKASREFLEFVSRPESGVNTVHLQLAATGGSVPPLYGFMEVVRAFGEWMEAGRKLRLVLYVQSDVELSLTSDRIDVRELLTSRLIRFWVVVDSSGNAEPVRRALHRGADASLEEVLADLGVPSDLSGWSASVYPSPRKDSDERAIRCTPGLTLTAAGIVFGSVLILERRKQ